MSENSEDNIELLFIHPRTELYFEGFYYEAIFPKGIIGLVNSVNCKKSGLFHRDVTTAKVKRSQIIAMDCQWFYSLGSLVDLVAFIKSVNNKAKIIVGGYTAAIYSEILVNDYGCDFVIVGDAEIPFPLLVDALLKDQPIDNIPNLVYKSNVEGKITYRLTTDDYDKQNFTEFSWFTSLIHLLEKYKPIGNHYLGFPFLSIYKGCKYRCHNCYGYAPLQNQLCKRGIVARSPEAVRAELREFSKNDLIQWVLSVSDFIAHFGDRYASKIFSEKYNLNLKYLFYELPSKTILKEMMACFSELDIGFHTIENPVTAIETMKEVDFQELDSLLQIARTRKCRLSLWVDLNYGVKNVSYLKHIRILKKKYRCTLKDTAVLIERLPWFKDSKNLLQQEFDYFLKKSRKPPVLLKVIKHAYSLCLSLHPNLVHFLRNLLNSPFLLTFFVVYLLSTLKRRVLPDEHKDGNENVS